MYPILRSYLRDRFGAKNLKITNKIELYECDKSFKNITLVIKNDDHSFRIYNNWYLWDCILLKAYELPDNAIDEITDHYHRLERECNIKFKLA